MIMIMVDGSSQPLAPGAGLNGFWYVNAFAQDGTPITMQQYEQYLFQPDGLLAYVDANYATIPSQPYRAVMGQSMGGYGSLWLGIEHPTEFSTFCSDSGTPFWVLFTDLANTNTMYFSNLVLTETVNNPPGDGNLIEPGPASTKFITNSIYSYANAFSILNSNTSDFPYDVTLPFLVTSTQLPASPVLNNMGSLITNTLTVARFALKDPYNYIATQSATINRQTVYLDAGDSELANAVGAAYFSDNLINNLVDHEYVLIEGAHTTCLTDPSCSRFLTNLQRISAAFAAHGSYADDIRAKIQGIINLTLSDNAQLNIAQGAILGIETSNSNNSVTTTDVTLTLQDNAQLIIGTDTVPGGALQVGDRTTKSRLQGMSTLGTHTVNFALLLNGPGALVQVGQQGFLGFGVGVDGQYPAQPNFWGVSTLSNVYNVSITGLQGTLKHTHIQLGNQTDASLICFGSPSLPGYTNSIYDQAPINYSWSFTPGSAHIYGGGNILQIVDGLVMHPTILTATGLMPAIGARSILDTSTYVPDDFYDQNQASSTFYTNQITTGILSSDITLQDLTKVAQLPLNNVLIDQLFNYLVLVNYENQGTKSTNYSVFEEPNQVGYVDQGLIQRAAQSSLIPVPASRLNGFSKRAALVLNS